MVLTTDQKYQWLNWNGCVNSFCWSFLHYLSIGTSNESIPQTATQPAISPPPKPTISRIVSSAYLLNPSPRTSGNVATKMPSPVTAVKRTSSPHKEESPKKMKIEEVFEISRSYCSNVQNFEYSFQLQSADSHIPGFKYFVKWGVYFLFWLHCCFMYSACLGVSGLVFLLCWYSSCDICTALAQMLRF